MLYGHGDDAYKYHVELKANFSSNVWYKGCSEALLTHLKGQFHKIANYPAPNADHLTDQIVKYHKLQAHTVMVTNGATEAFYAIVETFKAEYVTIGIPTFMEYESASNKYDIKPQFFPRKALLTHSFKEDLVFLCNPNNPDGYYNSTEELEHVIQKYPDTTFVVDEAYIDFTNEVNTCLSLINTYKNLIIVKSLTKLFAIPGLRLGYIISSPTIIHKLLQHKMPWSVNTMAIEAGKYIFKHYDALQPDISELILQNKALQDAIQVIDGFEVVPSKTNYFLVRLDVPKSEELKTYLINKHQILIRDASNFNGLDAHYIRIACQSPEQNDLLIHALKQWRLSL